MNEGDGKRNFSNTAAQNSDSMFCEDVSDDVRQEENLESTTVKKCGEYMNEISKRISRQIHKNTQC